MYIIDGIAYAGEKKPDIKVCGIKPLSEHRLWLRFSTGEAKIFDFKPLLNKPAFKKLADEKLFKEVYLDYGVTVWENGEIDIAPETLYEGSIDASASA